MDEVRRAIRGDEAAFARIVRSRYGLVHARAYALTGDLHAADDLAQEVFLAAWRGIARLRRPEALDGWLLRITRNAALNWRRRQAYRRQLAERYRLEVPPSASGPDMAARETVLAGALWFRPAPATPSAVDPTDPTDRSDRSDRSDQSATASSLAGPEPTGAPDAPSPDAAEETTAAPGEKVESHG